MNYQSVKFLFFNNSEIVGVVSEDGIVKHLADLGQTELKKAKLADTMDPVPPIVDWDTPANVLVPLIRYSKCILVYKKIKNHRNYHSIRYSKNDGVI
jgi:transcriptional regulator, XRE family